MRSLKLNTSFKHQILVALIISVWLVLFLVLIAPFDIAELPFQIRLEILPFYGVISFVSYLLIIAIQNLVFRTTKKWTLLAEILLLVVFNIITLLSCFVYYKSDIINGEFDFGKFSTTVFLPIFIILVPILVICRWYLNKKAVKQDSQKIILSGDNKLDVLHIELSDLICISSADNYIEIHFLKRGHLHKKLLRNTLKNIQQDVPSLIKVHRSHLINPDHFKEWKNKNVIALTHTEVPISKNYRQVILDLDQSSLKSND